MLPPQLLQAPRVERLLPRRELVENQPQRIDVALDRRPLARKLLRRHVRRRPRHFPLDHVARRHRQAKVRDPRPSSPVHHHVRRLQIPVQNTLVMRRGQPRAQLPRDVQPLVGGRKTSDPLQERGQVLPVHVFHRQVVQPVDFPDVVHTAHVRVRDLTRDPHFRVEPLEALLLRREVLRQELQRHRLPELQVVRPVHLAHPASAEQPDDPVSLRQHGTRREPARLNRVRRRQTADRDRGWAAPQRRRRN